MNENKRKAIAVELVGLAAKLTDTDALPASAKSIGLLVGEKNFGLAGDDADAFEEMSSTLSQHSGWMFTSPYRVGDEVALSKTSDDEFVASKDHVNFETWQKEEAAHICRGRSTSPPRRPPRRSAALVRKLA